MSLLLIFALFAAQAATLDLVALAKTHGISSTFTGKEGIFLYNFTRQGERRETLLLIAGNSFEMQIENPKAARCISLLTAMPFNLGDGAELKIELSTTAGAWKEDKAISMDPAHVRADRAWIPVHMDLPSGLTTFRLRLHVSPGPRGDETGDWIGVAAGPERSCLLAGQ